MGGHGGTVSFLESASSDKQNRKNPPPAKFAAEPPAEAPPAEAPPAEFPAEPPAEAPPAETPPAEPPAEPPEEASPTVCKDCMFPFKKFDFCPKTGNPHQKAPILLPLMENKSTPKKRRTNVQGSGKTSYANAVIGVGTPFF